MQHSMEYVYIYILTVFSCCLAENTVPLVTKEASATVLQRHRRAWSPFEEWSADNLERECVEENCNYEEAWETSRNFDSANSLWAAYKDCKAQTYCKNDGVCKLTKSGATCQCKPFTSGPVCETTLKDTWYEEQAACEAGTYCKNDGVCTMLTFGARCNCPSNTEGAMGRCEDKLRPNHRTVAHECKVEKYCKHGGKCEWSKIDGYMEAACVCPKMTTGERCEHLLKPNWFEEKKACEEGTYCQNEAQCAMEISGAVCTCKDVLTTGQKCQIERHPSCKNPVPETCASCISLYRLVNDQCLAVNASIKPRLQNLESFFLPTNWEALLESGKKSEIFIKRHEVFPRRSSIYKWTPLHRAAVNGSFDNLQEIYSLMSDMGTLEDGTLETTVLLDEWAYPDAHGHLDGDTVLTASFRSPKKVDFLVDHGANLNHKVSGDYVIHLAACFGKQELLRYYIDMSEKELPKPKIPTRYWRKHTKWVFSSDGSRGRNLLEIAASCGNLENVKMLINEHGKELELDHSDERKESALHLALSREWYDLWDILVAPYKKHYPKIFFLGDTEYNNKNGYKGELEFKSRLIDITSVRRNSTTKAYIQGIMDSCRGKTSC